MAVFFNELAKWHEHVARQARSLLRMPVLSRACTKGTRTRSQVGNQPCGHNYSTVNGHTLSATFHNMQWQGNMVTDHDTYELCPAQVIQL